jgi:hypothetical protein
MAPGLTNLTARGLLLALATCSSPSKPPPVAVENQSEVVPAPEDGPLSRERIAATRPPRDPAEARARLIGAWEGRRYGYDAERDFAGEAGDDEPVDKFWFTSDGRYREEIDGCLHEGRYEVTVDIELRIYRERTCRGEAPYDWPNYIQGLDDEVFVLVDGMTGGLRAFRRR